MGDGQRDIDYDGEKPKIGAMSRLGDGDDRITQYQIGGAETEGLSNPHDRTTGHLRHCDLSIGSPQEFEPKLARAD